MIYGCLCGKTFRTKKQAQCHKEIMSSDDIFPHCTYKKTWYCFFIDFLCFLCEVKIYRSVGAVFIWITLDYHFSINLNLFESLMIGIGIGFLLA